MREMCEGMKVTTFTDDEGNVSSMRILCVWAFGVAAGISTISIMLPLFDKPIDQNAVWLTGLFLSAAFGGKVGQKFAEVKKPPR